MICYAVIDTNVLVSALLSNHTDATMVQLIGRLIRGEVVPIYSAEIMQEYQEVLSRKKFKFELNMINYILATIEIWYFGRGFIYRSNFARYEGFAIL